MLYFIRNISQIMLDYFLSYIFTILLAPLLHYLHAFPSPNSAIKKDYPVSANDFEPS